MDEQYRKRVDERAMELIRSGEYDHLVIPDRDARLGRNNQDDRGLSYSIRDIPTFDGNGDSLPHIHMLEFGDFLDNTGSEFRDLPQEPQAEDRVYHMTVIKDVVSNFKISLRGKPRIWFEMQYPTSADKPKTKGAYEKMVASFLTEHNPMDNTKEQLTMAWKTLNWNLTQEKLDDFVYKFRRIGQELGMTENEQLQYFKCSVSPHLYLYHKDATTIKEAMENIKRACALGEVSVVSPVETRTTQSAPFMQMTDSQDSRNESRKSDYVEFAGVKYQGKVDYIDEMLNKTNKLRKEVVKIEIEETVEIVGIVEIVETVEIVGTIETVGTVGTVEEVIGVIQTQVQKKIDIGLEVGIVLEVDLEVEEGLSRTVLTATNQITIGLVVIDIPKK